MLYPLKLQSICAMMCHGVLDPSHCRWNCYRKMHHDHDDDHHHNITVFFSSILLVIMMFTTITTIIIISPSSKSRNKIKQAKNAKQWSCFRHRHHHHHHHHDNNCKRRHHHHDYCTVIIWVFPKIGVPQNGWFMENPIKMDDLGYHYFRKHPYTIIIPY